MAIKTLGIIRKVNLEIGEEIIIRYAFTPENEKRMDMLLKKLERDEQIDRNFYLLKLDKVLPFHILESISEETINELS